VTSTTAYTFHDLAAVSAQGLTLEPLTAPEQWTQLDVSAWTDSTGAALGPRLIASFDTVRFASSFDIPGVYFAATARAPVTAQAGLGLFDLSAHCTKGTADTYSDSLYTGLSQEWTNCGGTGARTLVVAATPANSAFVILVIVTSLGDRDDVARQTIYNSFQVQAG
jgi:hypothetical protein